MAGKSKTERKCVGQNDECLSDLILFVICGKGVVFQESLRFKAQTRHEFQISIFILCLFLQIQVRDCYIAVGSVVADAPLIFHKNSI